MHPIGWYLAQGLRIPLGGYVSKDDPADPCHLPDGRTVCSGHGLVRCVICCRNYDFLEGQYYVDLDDSPDIDVNNDDDDNNNDDDNGKDEEELVDPPDPLPQAVLGYPVDLPSPKKGTGRVFPTRFTSDSSISVDSLFSGRKTTEGVQRQVRNLRKCDIYCVKDEDQRPSSGTVTVEFTHTDDPSEVLIRTDGACLGNGQSDPRAGWAFWHGDYIATRQEAVISGRLEKGGPFGDSALQTSNRAELRAVIAALRWGKWWDNGFRTVIVATDSGYVVSGATLWTKPWTRHDWTTAKGNPVRNRDLWEALLGEVERWDEDGVKIEFWKIPRALNAVADAAAYRAAEQGSAPDQWRD